MLLPINLKQWIEDHRDKLRPPVGNQVVYRDTDFIIMVVGGPNSREDYHINPTEEFFYQIEGDIVVKIRENGQGKDIAIKAGDIFLLPAHVPHSPQRPQGSVGLVIERQRTEADGFQWFCRFCDDLLYEEFFPVTDIVAQLPPLFERFYNNLAHSTCRGCGKKHERRRAGYD